MSQRKPETPVAVEGPGTLEERAAHGASEIAHSIELAGPEDRSSLVHAAGEELEKQGLIIVDLHDAYRALGDFNADALPGVVGAQTGKTRAQLLGQLSVRSPRRTGRTRRRR